MRPRYHEVSGQPLTPVLKHGEQVIFDSASILRYLEANFRDSPQLFSHDYAEMKKIEEWEWFARTDCSRPVGEVFRAAQAGDIDLAGVGLGPLTHYEEERKHLRVAHYALPAPCKGKRTDLRIGQSQTL